jgi:hypothetical protein
MGDRYVMTYTEFDASNNRRAMYTTLTPELGVATQPFQVGAAFQTAADVYFTGYARSPSGHTLVVLERSDVISGPYDGFLVFLAPR